MRITEKRTRYNTNNTEIIIYNNYPFFIICYTASKITKSVYHNIKSIYHLYYPIFTIRIFKSCQWKCASCASHAHFIPIVSLSHNLSPRTRMWFERTPWWMSHIPLYTMRCSCAVYMFEIEAQLCENHTVCVRNLWCDFCTEREHIKSLSSILREN